MIREGGSNIVPTAEYVAADLVALRFVMNSAATIPMLGGWARSLVSGLPLGLVILVLLAAFFPLQFLISISLVTLLFLVARAFLAVRIVPDMNILIAVIISLTRDSRTGGMRMELVPEPQLTRKRRLHMLHHLRRRTGLPRITLTLRANKTMIMHVIARVRTCNLLSLVLLQFLLVLVLVLCALLVRRRRRRLVKGTLMLRRALAACFHLLICIIRVALQTTVTSTMSMRVVRRVLSPVPVGRNIMRPTTTAFLTVML